MKRAVSTSYFLLTMFCVAIIASLFVIADATITDAGANATNSTVPDALPSAQAALVDALVPSGETLNLAEVTLQGKPLSTPVQAITACREDAACATAGYLVALSTIINTTDYNCTIIDDGKLYLTCDSLYDGNGDGVCTSGESCIQFGIVGNYVTRNERNSHDAWVEHDESFVLRRAEVRE